jgi:hypothetical protein
VIDNDLLLTLFSRHVLLPGERIEAVKTWPDALGVMVETDGRFVSVRADPDFLRAGHAPWVDALVVVQREDVLTHGERETDAILLDGAGRSYHLNDAATAANLGRRVGADLDPVAYAEILLAYHPFSVARRDLVTSPDHLTTRLGIVAGPEVAAPDHRATPAGAALTFYSTAVYAPMLGAPLRCDVHHWQVALPAGAPATWTRHLLAIHLAVPPPTGPAGG